MGQVCCVQAINWRLSDARQSVFDPRGLLSSVVPRVWLELCQALCEHWHQSLVAGDLITRHAFGLLQIRCELLVTCSNDCKSTFVTRTMMWIDCIPIDWNAPLVNSMGTWCFSNKSRSINTSATIPRCRTNEKQVHWQMNFIIPAPFDRFVDLIVLRALLTWLWATKYTRHRTASVRAREPCCEARLLLGTPIRGVYIGNVLWWPMWLTCSERMILR